jgi:hypothetical protein
MGTRGVRGQKQEKQLLTEQDIITVLNRYYHVSPKYLLSNLYVFQHESDYLALTKSGYWYEVEVKISRNDFFNDFKKVEKHEILSGIREGYKPNYFSYACPENLIKVEEVPEYAGLIYIKDKNDYYGTTVKTAPQLHKTKISPEELNLVDKFYYNYTNYKTKYQNNEKDRLITELKQLIKELKTEHEKEIQLIKEQYDSNYQYKVLKEEFKKIAGFDYEEIF